MLAGLFRSTNVAAVMAGGGGGGGFDYTAANDAELDEILTYGNTTLSGKSVGLLRGATFTTKTFSTNTALPLRFGAYGTGNKPRIENAWINGAQNLVIEDIAFTSSTWQFNPLACLRWSGSFGNITLRRCDRIGNYRGTLGVIDPTATYPEYACIIPVFDNSGVITGFNIIRPTVGDLMANGTYTMSFNSVSGITFSTLPQGEFTVVGGQITGTTLINGGASNATTSTGVGILSALITWTGQRRMLEWLPYGDEASGAIPQNGLVRDEDGYWVCLSNGYKVGVQSGQTVEIIGSRCDLCYQDSISIGFGNGSAVATQRVMWGYWSRPFALSGDAGDPHGDGHQTFTGKALCNYEPIVESHGNIAYLGTTRGAFSNLFFFSDKEGVPDQGYRVYATGNIGMGGGGINGLAIAQTARNSFVWGNSVGRMEPTGGASTTSLIRFGIDNVYGNNFCGNNITEGLGVAPGPGTVETAASPNLLLGLRGATIAYSSVFDNPGITGLPTISQIVAAYQTKAPYTGAGNTITGYIDYINRTIDRTKEPTFVAFPSKVDQVLSSVTLSDWMCIIGGPDIVTVASTGSEYRVADDAVGTNATAWGAAGSTTTKGKFIQTRVTNSGSSATATSATVSLNGYVYSFSSTTVSTAVYPMVEFSGDDRWQRVAGAIGSDSYTGGLYLPRFKMTRPGALTTIFTTTSGVGHLTIAVLNTGFMRITLRNASGPIAVINTSTSVADPTATEHDIKVSWDTSQATSALGVSIYIDGASALGSVTTWTPALVSWGVAPTGGGSYCFGGTASVYAIFQTGGLWLHTTDRPDLTSAVVRAKFYPDTIGTQGQNPTGTAPAYWLNGNAAEWNDVSGLNDGANTNKFGGGSMTTPASTGGVGTVTNV